MNKKVIIVGSGIGGLGLSCLLAKKGCSVEVFEKNKVIGGRARVFSAEGYRFDMGPSWYLMPDVFEHFFELMDTSVAEELTINKLNPSYRIFFKSEGIVRDFYSDISKNIPIFEELEPGSGKKLLQFLEKSEYQYDIAKNCFMYRNYNSVFDFLNRDTLIEGRKLSVFSRMQSYVERYFKNELLQKVMQYHLVFLGSSPYNTPALYNIMSHIDFNGGVFYPEGGIGAVIDSLVGLAEKNGVRFFSNSAVSKIQVNKGLANGVILDDGSFHAADLVVSNGDMHYTETTLLDPVYRSYSESYWSSRTLSPSAFILYLGVRGTIDSLVHHNLVFCKDWKKNFSQIFDSPQWPDDPSWYVCCPSKTDSTVAPEGCENLFVLVPIAPRLSYTTEELEAYAITTIQSLELVMNIPNLAQRIEYKRIYCVNDFILDYHSYGGSALGLSHTLSQTAVFRPNNVSKKVSNLYYVGAGTNPGIGLPIGLISAELAYKRITHSTEIAPLTAL